MATHCSILAWEIPWTEEPGGLQSVGSQRVGHDWVTLTHSLITHLAGPSEMKVLVTHSCQILCAHTGCSPPGSSVHGISQARILQWVVILSSRGSSQPRDWTCISCIVSGFFIIWATRPLAEPKWDTNQWNGELQLCGKSPKVKIGSPGFQFQLQVGAFPYWKIWIKHSALACCYGYCGKQTRQGIWNSKRAIEIQEFLTSWIQWIHMFWRQETSVLGF